MKIGQFVTLTSFDVDGVETRETVQIVELHKFTARVQIGVSRFNVALTSLEVK